MREAESGRRGVGESGSRGEEEISSRSPFHPFSPTPLLPFSLSLLHLAVALPLAYFLNIWADEGSTLYTTENGLFTTFQNVLADEKQAPLYFLFLSLWREIDASIFWARLPSIVFSALAIRVFYDLARRVFEARTALFVTAFFALHPYLVWASLEIRGYSLVVLLSVLLLKFFADGYLELSAKTRSAQIFYVLTALVALYTNYYLGFLLVGNFAALVALRRQCEAKRYFLQMLAVGALFVPLVWAIKSQFAANTVAFQTERSLLTGLQILWNNFLTFTLPTEIHPPDEISCVSFIRVWFVRIGVLLGAYFLIKKRREIFDEKTLALGAVAATIFAFLLVAYLLLGEVYVAIRHFAVVFAPVILLAALVLAKILPPQARLLLVILYVFLFSYSFVTLYPHAAKRGDWARVAEFIRQKESAHQRLVVFTTFDALALRYHYKGANEILPDEKFFDFELEAEPGSADAWRRQTAFIISEIPPDADEIWLLTNEKCAVKDSCRPLENFVAANYTIIEEKDFYKEKVRLLRRKR